MITRDDHEVFGDWCRDQLHLYDAVVCLDGSESDATRRIAAGFPGRLIHLHERNFEIPHKTDHGLRRVVHQEVCRRFGHGHWIMCCHPDEFCYHDPRKIAEKAEREGFDHVSWFSLHFLPHPDERADWQRRRPLPVPERHRHYHWSFDGDGLPWVEDRLYRADPTIAWDGRTHGNVRPLGLKKLAPFHPTLRHYKVIGTDMALYDAGETYTRYRHHWIEAAARTGLPFPVRKLDDLFVRALPRYSRCSRFHGALDHLWNMGEEYRPGPRDASTLVAPIRANWRMQLPTHITEVSFLTRGIVDEAIVRDLWERDAYGLRRLSERPKTVVDVGAHIGAFAALAAEMWTGVRVIACEPDAGNAALLRQNISGRFNVEVVEKAIVGDDRAHVEFYAVPDKAGSNSGGGSCVRPEHDSVRNWVPAMSVAQLWREKKIGVCDLLKLDCEGGESAILRGLADAGLLPSVRTIVGEWHAPECSPGACHQVRAEIAAIVSATHSVDFAPLRPGREGYFTARLRF